MSIAKYYCINMCSRAYLPPNPQLLSFVFEYHRDVHGDSAQMCQLHTLKLTFQVDKATQRPLMV